MYSLIAYRPRYPLDIQCCLDSLSSPSTSEILVSVSTEGNDFSWPLTFTLSREKLRAWRVPQVNIQSD